MCLLERKIITFYVFYLRQNTWESFIVYACPLSIQSYYQNAYP